MAASSKVSRLDVPRVPVVPRGNEFPAFEIVSKPVKLDFAANSNRYRVNGGVEKSKTVKRARGVALSPRLELLLNVQCDAIQEQDPEME